MGAALGVHMGSTGTGGGGVDQSLGEVLDCFDCVVERSLEGLEDRLCLFKFALKIALALCAVRRERDVGRGHNVLDGWCSVDSSGMVAVNRGIMANSL